jgi:hypothetical protein
MYCKQDARPTILTAPPRLAVVLPLINSQYCHRGGHQFASMLIMSLKGLWGRDGGGSEFLGIAWG